MNKTTTRSSTTAKKTKAVAAAEKQPVLYKKIGMAQAKRLANELHRFVSDNRLVYDIAGKDYMGVEGWQFIGTQLGLTEIVIHCDPVNANDPKEIKYKSAVNVINQNGTVISRGFAFASNLEKGRSGSVKWKDEYAVASMAQTRAIGKAYRNFLAWIVKMAGYEATPYEEANRDTLEQDLGIAKRNVVRQLHDSGIEDSSDMMCIIQTVTGKSVLETVDDCRDVINYLKELEDV